jgi:selenocysteine-specific elongation factor
MGGLLLAGDVRDALETAATTAVAGPGAIAAAELRTVLAGEARRRIPITVQAATSLVDAIIDGLVAGGGLVRDRDRILPAGASTGPDPVLVAAMERLEAMLAVAAPPSLREAGLAARCPIEGIRMLESAGRIVRVEDDLAWEAGTLRRFWLLALRLAAAGPLSPATFRDATGTSRRFALAILEDLDRRAVLRRTPAGHVPGPRASSVEAAGGGA